MLLQSSSTSLGAYTSTISTWCIHFVGALVPLTSGTSLVTLEAVSWVPPSGVMISSTEARGVFLVLWKDYRVTIALENNLLIVCTITQVS